ncbi:MAG: hypothetical protein JOZ47_05535 [Kutzneria sp.]|nr:hypothetical protein [Kutzneria sp.]MBV9844515.1 hypothetical protein [Kutzneria sp.]
MDILLISILGALAAGCWLCILRPTSTHVVTRPLSLRRSRRSTERLLRDLAATGQLAPPLPRRGNEHLDVSHVTIVRRTVPSVPEPTGCRTPDIVA